MRCLRNLARGAKSRRLRSHFQVGQRFHWRSFLQVGTGFSWGLFMASRWDTAPCLQVWSPACLVSSTFRQFRHELRLDQKSRPQDPWNKTDTLVALMPTDWDKFWHVGPRQGPTRDNRRSPRKGTRIGYFSKCQVLKFTGAESSGTCFVLLNFVGSRPSVHPCERIVMSSRPSCVKFQPPCIHCLNLFKSVSCAAAIEQRHDLIHESTWYGGTLWLTSGSSSFSFSCYYSLVSYSRRKLG